MSHRTSRLVLTTLVCLSWGHHQLLAEELGGFAVRFTSSGSIDTSFGDQGSVRVFHLQGTARAAVVDGQNRVVIAGTRDGKFVVTRLLASGAIDESFGTDGVAEKAFAASADARAVAIDPWERIIVAGTSSTSFAVACFSSSGGTCPFNVDSKVTASFPYLSAEAAAIAIGADGRIVVGGRAWFWPGGTREEMFALARFNPSGVLDPSFGTTGKRLYNVGPATTSNNNVESIAGLAIDSSARIVAAGTYKTPTLKARFALLRFDTNGDPDTTFGANSNGMVNAFGGCSGIACFEDSFATSVALQPDGKVVVAGAVRLLGAPSSGYDLALARFLPDGSLDVNGFGNNGYVRKYLDGYQEAAALKLAGGSLYVAGHSEGLALVARFSAANGALDSEFNGGLVMMTTPPCELPGGAAPAFALVVQTFQAAGFIYARKPVIVGTCSPSN